jgi:hypothetical protein
VALRLMLSGQDVFRIIGRISESGTNMLQRITMRPLNRRLKSSAHNGRNAIMLRSDVGLVEDDNVRKVSIRETTNAEC